VLGPSPVSVLKPCKLSLPNVSPCCTPFPLLPLFNIALDRLDNTPHSVHTNTPPFPFSAPAVYSAPIVVNIEYYHGGVKRVKTGMSAYIASANPVQYSSVIIAS
jgi:hypothetical protein